MADLEAWSTQEEHQLSTIIALTIDIAGINHHGDLGQVTLIEVHQGMSQTLTRELPPGKSQSLDLAARIIFLHLHAVAEQGSPQQRRNPSDFSLQRRLQQLSDPAPAPTSTRHTVPRPSEAELVDDAINVRSDVGIVGGEPVIILGHVGQLQVWSATAYEDVDVLGSLFRRHGARAVPLSPFGQPQFPRQPSPGWEARLTGTELVVTAEGGLIYDGGLAPDREWIDQAAEHITIFRGITLLHYPPGKLNELVDILQAGDAIAVRTAITLA